MEYIVMECLDAVLERYCYVCKCQQCKEDIVALALNQLQPKYFTSIEGSAYIKLNAMDSQYKVDVLKALTAAVEKVSANMHNHVHENLK